MLQTRNGDDSNDKRIKLNQHIGEPIIDIYSNEYKFWDDFWLNGQFEMVTANRLHRSLTNTDEQHKNEQRHETTLKRRR